MKTIVFYATAVLIAISFALVIAQDLPEKKELEKEVKKEVKSAEQVIEKKMEMDVVDTAIKNGSFNTLVTALKTAGLVETLKGKGPFTVFAPSDSAFAKLSKAKLDSLLANKQELTNLLNCHVANGKFMAADVAKMDSINTIGGMIVRIKTGKESVMVGDAKVVKADIVASNGVIHAIDSVIMPKKEKQAVK